MRADWTRRRRTHTVCIVSLALARTAYAQAVPAEGIAPVPAHEAQSDAGAPAQRVPSKTSSLAPGDEAPPQQAAEAPPKAADASREDQPGSGSMVAPPSGPEPDSAKKSIDSDDREPSTEPPRPENGYWSVGKPRWFLAFRPEIGTPYFKPVLMAGYGMPHWISATVEANSIVTLDLGQVGATVRAALPILDLSLLIRDTWSWSKPFLDPASSFTRDMVFGAPGASARYAALEGEIDAIAPLPYSALVVAFIFVNVLDMPSGKYLYEENYRLITKNPLFYVLRVAAVARFLGEQSLKVGLLSELGFGTGRDGTVFRLGPIFAVQATDHLQVQAGATVVLSSPDHLGLTLGAYGVAGIQLKYATGEPKPAFPWHEKFIPF